MARRTCVACNAGLEAVAARAGRTTFDVDGDVRAFALNEAPASADEGA